MFARRDGACIWVGNAKKQNVLRFLLFCPNFFSGFFCLFYVVFRHRSELAGKLVEDGVYRKLGFNTKQSDWIAAA